MKLTHGGDIYGYQSAYNGKTPLDLSANLNPLGMPQSLKNALKIAVENCEAYPDPLCREVRAALSIREQVPSEMLYCGNGAADVLDRIAAVIQPRTALLCAPTFSEYERTLRGSKLAFYMLQKADDFSVTKRILMDITPNLDAVYLCNPNNPTGGLIGRDLMCAILQQCVRHDIWLIVDECFLDFVPDGEAYSLKPFLKHKKIVIVKALTKLYAMAGVRFGYCLCADATLPQQLFLAGQPWNVSTLAQVCALAACKETSFAQKTVLYVAELRENLMREFACRRIKAYESAANYILFYEYLPSFAQKMKEKGILIRDCSNYRGLNAGYYRIAVRDKQTQAVFFTAYDQIREEVQHGENHYDTRNGF